MGLILFLGIPLAYFGIGVLIARYLHKNGKDTAVTLFDCVCCTVLWLAVLDEVMSVRKKKRGGTDSLFIKWSKQLYGIEK